MHPGNILVRMKQSKASDTGLFKSKPHVVFLDVGMTAELSKKDRVNLIEFFKAVALQNGRAAAEHTLKFSKHQSCPNPAAFVKVSVSHSVKLFYMYAIVYLTSVQLKECVL